MKIIYVLALISIAFVSCSGEEKRQENNQHEPAQQKKVIEKQGALEVKGNNFLGIQPNDPLENHIEALQKGKIRDGEKILEVYNIEVKGYELGYLLLHSEDKSLVGNIVLQSEKVEMDNGVKVGMTFADLEKKYTDLELLTSDNKGEFYAITDGFRFRLRHDKVDNVYRDIAKISEIILLEK